MSSFSDPTISPSLFYKTSQRPVKVAKVECIHPSFWKEMPRWMSSVVHGPTLEWKVFKKQAEALQFSKDHGEGLMTFVFQDSEGTRRFLSAHPVVFWFYDNNMKRLEDRHSYEVVTEGSMCKLYFDLEFDKICNANSNGVQMTHTFIQIVSWFLQETFGVHCDRKFVLDLDSTTESKFSRHLIFQLPKTYFRDNCHVGNFVRLICNKLKMLVLSPSFLHELASKSGVSEEEVLSLFVNDKHGNRKLFCDEAVYTKNRHFRLYKSSKWKKNNPLLVSAENEYKPTARERREKKPLAEKEIFLDSLISYVDPEAENVTVLEYGHVEPKKYDIKSGSNLSKSPLVSEQGIPSTLPSLDKFILDLVSPGYIRCSKYFSQKNIIVYEICKNRFCNNIQRSHKSNNIYYVVDLRSYMYFQKCHDPDCSGYRSAEKCLPPEIVFMLENEDDTCLKSVSTMSDEELQDVWQAVSFVEAIDSKDSLGAGGHFPDFGMSDTELLNSSSNLEDGN